MSPFALVTLVGWAATALAAARIRGARGLLFAGVLVGIYSLVALSLSRWVGAFLPAFIYFHVAAYLSFFMLARGRMRWLAFHVLVSWPGSWFLAATMLAFPWAIASAFGLRPVGFWIPYAIALLGFLDTFLPRRRETVPITVGGVRVGFGRAKSGKGSDPRPLRIMQITDPHLGPFMSVRRLRKICERIVEARPDLVLLTGDFLTRESNADVGLLDVALAPLAKLPGRCFACFGNHDHEAPAHVRAGLASAGITLLVDELAQVDTEAGPVEILGYDFRGRATRAAHLAQVSAKHPRTDRLRIGLLHDPGAFRHLPEGAADLVFAGHTHGGQLGLLWLGLPHTFVSTFTSVPDHGLWFRNGDLLYVHRGTGHYGFPLRLGVPPEDSILEIHRSLSGMGGGSG